AECEHGALLWMRSVDAVNVGAGQVAIEGPSLMASFKKSERHRMAASTPREVLTPDALALLQTVAREGSFAAAARELGLVPSAVTYRIRQVEDALDALLFDRASRQARLTPAGAELLREGERLLGEVDAVANR